MDAVSKEKRRKIMSKVRGKNTGPEIKVRKLLHSMGYRFRLHRKDLPGTPDIVLPKYKTVIFVHGCFWHQHMSCSRAFKPKTNCDYWNTKFVTNVKRDKDNIKQLLKLGWRPFIIWECQTKNHDILKLAIVNCLTFTG